MRPPRDRGFLWAFSRWRRLSAFRFEIPLRCSVCGFYDPARVDRDAWYRSDEHKLLCPRCAQPARRDAA